MNIIRILLINNKVSQVNHNMFKLMIKNNIVYYLTKLFQM